MPAYFIWGQQDVFQSSEQAKTLVSQLPENYFTIVNDAGHCPWFDQQIASCWLINLTKENCSEVTEIIVKVLPYLFYQSDSIPILRLQIICQ